MKTFFDIKKLLLTLNTAGGYCESIGPSSPPGTSHCDTSSSDTIGNEKLEAQTGEDL